MRRLQLIQGKKGLELRGKGLIIEEGNPKFNEFLARDGKDFLIEEVMPDSRMAGDIDISDLLKSLEGDVALEKAVADAQVYMEDRVPELEALGLLQGGRKPSKAEDMLLKLGRLKGNVPMPYRKLKDGIDTRTHTQYSINPVTGLEEVVGFKDPNAPDTVLKSVFGTKDRKVLSRDRRGNPEYQRADEEVAENVMKLMGRQTKARGHGYKGLSDLVSGGKNVDVMQRPSYTNNSLITALTALRNADAGYSSGPQISKTVESMLRREMNSNGGKLLAATDKLLDSGQLDDTFTPNMMLGKIGRADTARMPTRQEVYDELIMPGYNRDLQSIPMRDPDAPAKTTYAPDSIHLADLHQAVEYLNQGISGRQLVMKPNYGESGKGKARAQAKVRIPNSVPFIQDLTVSHPMTQQMLSVQELNRRKDPS